MSFATNLMTDVRTIELPSWEDVERAIYALDADTVTEVMLSPAPPLGSPSGDHHLGIGGGARGLCVVYFTEDNLRFWNLVEPGWAQTTEEIRMLIGGQEGDFRRSQLVPREMALKAARAYFECGVRASDLVWEQG